MFGRWFSLAVFGKVLGLAAVVQLAEQVSCKYHVGGSNPSCGTILLIAQFGRAPALGAGGRMFKSCCGDQNILG